MLTFRCDRCFGVLYETDRADGSLVRPDRAAAPWTEEYGRLFLGCPGCGARVEFTSATPGADFVQPRRGVIRG